MHQCVNLQLCLVEGVRSRIHHVLVNYLSHSGVQAHLQDESKSVPRTPSTSGAGASHLLGRQYRNVVLVDEPRFLFYYYRIRLLFEVFAS